MHLGKIVPVAMALTLVAGCASAAVPTSPSPADPTPSTPAAATATHTPPSTPTTVAGARDIPGSGPIEPGRYYIAEGPWTPASFSFTMPAGWVAENGGQTVSKHPNESGRETSWSVSVVDRLFADPCGPNDTIDVGPTADHLAAALRALPGPDVSIPVDVTIGGRSWKVVEVTVPADVDVEKCDPPIGLQVWLDRGGNKYFLAGHESVARIYMVDVDGARFVVVANHRPTSAPEDIAEMEAIIASIEFEL
jgi:hypothetical protein